MRRKGRDNVLKTIIKTFFSKQIFSPTKIQNALYFRYFTHFMFRRNFREHFRLQFREHLRLHFRAHFRDGFRTHSRNTEIDMPANLTLASKT